VLFRYIGHYFAAVDASVDADGIPAFVHTGRKTGRGARQQRNVGERGAMGGDITRAAVEGRTAPRIMLL